MEFKLLKNKGFNQVIKVKNVTDNREVVLGTLTSKIKTVLTEHGMSITYDAVDATDVATDYIKPLHPTTQWDVNISKELAQALLTATTTTSTSKTTTILPKTNDTQEQQDTSKQPVDIFALIFNNKN